jgi:hypothetical protein
MSYCNKILQGSYTRYFIHFTLLQVIVLSGSDVIEILAIDETEPAPP